MQALAIAGGILGTITQVQQLQYQSAIAGVNAQQMRYNADAASQAAGLDVQDIGQQGAGEAGTLVANQGASGLSLSSPSFTAGASGFLSRVYQSAVRRQTEGNQQYAAYKTQANSYDAEAKNAKSAIPFAILSGAISTAGSFFSTQKNFFASAQPTAASATAYTSPASSIGMIPTPRLRPRLSSPIGRGR